MSEEELKAFTERLCDRLPNKMEMVNYSWSRRWDAYRFVIPAVVRALGLVAPPSEAERVAKMTPAERKAYDVGRHSHCTKDRCFDGHVRYCPGRAG